MNKILPALFFIVACLPLAAQDEPDKPKRGILIRGFASSLFEDIDKLELRTPERLVGSLELPTGQLREATTVTARTFAYGVTVNEEFRVLGNVALPAAGRNFIIVFAPIETGYHAIAVRSDHPDFRGNDTYLFNFTKRHIGVKLGTAKQLIAPMKNAKMRPAFPEDATFYQAMFAYKKDEKYIPFNNTRWPVNPNIKSLLFVFEDPTTGRLSYRSIIELAR